MEPGRCVGDNLPSFFNAYHADTVLFRWFGIPRFLGGIGDDQLLFLVFGSLLIPPLSRADFEVFSVGGVQNRSLLENLFRLHFSSSLAGFQKGEIPRGVFEFQGGSRESIRPGPCRPCRR